MNNNDRLEAVAKSEDTRDLLEHISWTVLVKPAMLKKKNDLTTLLVGSVLGQAMPNNLTKEQVAGFIFGIDEIIRMFEKILRDGERALTQLESQGFHIDQLSTIESVV